MFLFIVGVLVALVVISVLLDASIVLSVVALCVHAICFLVGLVYVVGKDKKNKKDKREQHYKDNVRY